MPLWARPAAAAGPPDTARQAGFRKAGGAGGERSSRENALTAGSRQWKAGA